MYSRSNSNDPRNRETRIPPNYGGSAFAQRETPVRATPSRNIMSRHNAERDIQPSRDDRYRTSNAYESNEKYEDERYGLREEDCERCERCENCPENLSEREADHPERADRDDRENSEDHRQKHDIKEDKEDKNDKKDESKPFSILSPIGALGTEELLLIALALIIFQSGNEPELALILLALLFIN